MLIVLENVLTAEQVTHIRQQLMMTDNSPVKPSPWLDGKLSAGGAASHVKHNQQLNPQHPVYSALAERCLNALSQHLIFLSAGLPKTILPPIFSDYQQGQHYGNHVDNALHRLDSHWVRTDLSLTLFLSEPESYAGGELIIDDHYGEHAVKLAAGDAIMYPSTSVHRVAPVTSGQRLAMVTWIQSLIRDDNQRQILHQLDISQTLLRQKISQLAVSEPQLLSTVEDDLQTLAHVYHNLLRQWSDC